MRKGIWSLQFGEVKKEELIRESLPHWDNGGSRAALLGGWKLSYPHGWAPGLLPPGRWGVCVCVCMPAYVCRQNLLYGLLGNSP